MFEFITQFLEDHGYLGVFALMAAENVFPPIPSEMIMPFAGFVVARGELDLAGVLACGTIGSVAGSLPWFYAARAYGCMRLKKIAERKARWLTVTPDDIDSSVRTFRRHGAKAILFGRLIPAIRSIISAPAGIANMPLPKFLLYSSIGSLAWTGLLMAGGFLLEDKYSQVSGYVDPVSKAIFGILLAWYLYRVATYQRPNARS